MEPIPLEGSREGGGNPEEGREDTEEGGGHVEDVVKLPSVAERISQMETQLDNDKLPASSPTASAALSVCDDQ